MTSMKFYFCEKCGKRLTEHDIEVGEAKNKKLRGIFCTECSMGVMTMESIPLTDLEAQKIIAHETQSVPSTTP